MPILRQQIPHFTGKYHVLISAAMPTTFPVVTVITHTLHAMNTGIQHIFIVGGCNQMSTKLIIKLSVMSTYIIIHDCFALKF